MRGKEQVRTSESRSETGWRSRPFAAAAALAIGLMLLMPSPTLAQPVTITARVAADDEFMIGAGPYAGPTSLSTVFAPGETAQGGETGVTVIADPNTGFIYIVAAGNNSGRAGILGEFEVGTGGNRSIRFTGAGSPWSVCATGVDWDPAAAPLLGDVTTAVGICNAGTGASATTSVRWVTLFDQGGGIRADGELNEAGGNFPFVPNIAHDARWMWFNPTGGIFAPTGFADSFTPSAPSPAGKEYYIFRVPVIWLMSQCFTAFSDEIKTPVNSVEYWIKGCPAVVDTYNGPYVTPNGVPVAGTIFPNPTISCFGTYSKVEWISPGPLSSAKVGVTLGTCLNTQYDVTTDPNATLLCANHVGVDRSGLRGGVLKFSYPNRSESAANCPTPPSQLFIRNVSSEVYDRDHVPAAADINAAKGPNPSRPHPGPIREPMPEGRGSDQQPLTINFGGTVTSPRALPQPLPRDATHALIIYNVTTNLANDPNTDTTVYALLPLGTQGEIPMLSGWGVISLVVLLILASWLVIRRRSTQAHVS